LWIRNTEERVLEKLRQLGMLLIKVRHQVSDIRDRTVDKNERKLCYLDWEFIEFNLTKQGNIEE